MVAGHDGNSKTPQPDQGAPHEYSLAGFRTALDRWSKDPWARGVTPRKAEHADWRFGFDYFLKPDTFAKIMERGDAPPRQSTPPPGQRNHVQDDIDFVARMRLEEAGHGE